MIKLAKKVAYNCLVRLFPSRMGYVVKPKGEGYFNAANIIKNAQAKGMTVTEYLETDNIGGVGKRRDLIIDKLKMLGVMNKAGVIIEIGAGTGMYMEKFIEYSKPHVYEVYETNLGWSKYLNSTYKQAVDTLLVHSANGVSLVQSKNESADLVTAHGVFVYLPIVVTFQYLQEIARVCKIGGLVIFDCFTDRIFTMEEIIRFKQVNSGYDFPVVISEVAIKTFCEKYEFTILSTFNIPYHLTHCTYFILQKN